MKKNLLLLPLLLLVGLMAINAQITTPAPSPGSTLMQKVGLTDVTVEYSRPSMKGRTIFSADGLVPFGKIWRTGANSATKITFSDDVTVEGAALKAGSYAVLTIPTANSWTVNFYTFDKAGFGGYVEMDPTASVSVVPQANSNTVESFAIHFDGMSNTGATMLILWENTMVPVKIGVDVDTKVMAAIDRVMAGPSANDYYAAASYYHDSGKDLKKALEWVKIATAGDEPRFWQVRKKSLILADLGMKAEAIAAAKHSLELATAAGNADYIKMNEESIKKWSM